MTETPILDDRAVSEIEARMRQWEANYNLPFKDIVALIATVKHLRAENDEYERRWRNQTQRNHTLSQSNRELQSQLEQLRAENQRLTESLSKTNALGEEMLTRMEKVAGIGTKADHGWYYVMNQVESRLAQVEQERDALRDSASIVAFQAHQIDEKIAESLITQGGNDFRSRVLELCKSKAAECEREAENADMRLRSSERDVIENEARAIKELATELEKL